MTVLVRDPDLTIHVGDALEVLATLPDGSVDAVVTSPPYLDARPEYDSPTGLEFGSIFCELARVVRGGMLWNVGRLWRDGVEQLWWTELIRQASCAGWQHWDTEVWVKPNANPIHGRVLTNSHEYVLFFGRDGVRFNEDGARTAYTDESKARMARTWINGRGVKGDTRGHQTGREINPLGARGRSYFSASVGKEKGNGHPAPMAEEVARHLVGLASWPGQAILDPFGGSGTTAVASRALGRSCVLIEKDTGYALLAAERSSQLSLLAEVGAACAHTPAPVGYVTPFDFAARMARDGYEQERCPACGLWAVWVPVSEGAA